MSRVNLIFFVFIHVLYIFKDILFKIFTVIFQTIPKFNIIDINFV